MNAPQLLTIATPTHCARTKRETSRALAILDSLEMDSPALVQHGASFLEFHSRAAEHSCLHLLLFGPWLNIVLDFRRVDFVV